MALVYNDKIKEIRRKQPGEMLLIIVPDKLLIQRKIDLVRGDGVLFVLCHVDFVDYLFQRGKVLLNGLVNQNVAVREVKHFALHAALE